MPDSILRRARRAQKLSQMQLAEQAGVSAATLARWESGKSQIPAEKASLLAALLGVPIPTADAPVVLASSLLSQQDEEHDDGDGDLYFGEVAIHFRSGGRPLMVSIDQAVRSHIYAQFDEMNLSILTFDTLDNRSVYVRKSAISDLHFSSNDVDTCGPEHARYGEAILGISSTDEREFSDPDVEGGRDPVDAFAGRPPCLLSDFWRAVASDPCDEGTPEDLRNEVERARRSNDARSYQLLASYMFWQVEGAQRRGLPCSRDPRLSNWLFELCLGDFGESDMLHLCCGDAGLYDHSVMVNVASLEYLSVPTQMLEDSYLAIANRDELKT